jgi:hypothetical protein
MRERPDLYDVAKRIDIQNENRTLWELNDTPEELERIFDIEVEEMRECEANFFLKDYADFHMISEVGDVGYLFLRYQSLYDHVPERMVKKLSEAINISSRCGFTMTDAVEMKLWRNSHKYGDVHFDAFGDFKEGVGASKRLWEAMGGDEAFFHWYMEEYGE